MISLPSMKNKIKSLPNSHTKVNNVNTVSDESRFRAVRLLESSKDGEWKIQNGTQKCDFENHSEENVSQLNINQQSKIINSNIPGHKTEMSTFKKITKYSPNLNNGKISTMGMQSDSKSCPPNFLVKDDVNA